MGLRKALLCHGLGCRLLCLIRIPGAIRQPPVGQNRAGRHGRRRHGQRGFGRSGRCRRGHNGRRWLRPCGGGPTCRRSLGRLSFVLDPQVFLELLQLGLVSHDVFGVCLDPLLVGLDSLFPFSFQIFHRLVRTANHYRRGNGGCHDGVYLVLEEVAPGHVRPGGHLVLEIRVDGVCHFRRDLLEHFVDQFLADADVGPEECLEGNEFGQTFHGP